MDITTIDEKLRKAAREQLARDVEKLFEQFEAGIKALAAEPFLVGWMRTNLHRKDGDRYERIDADQVLRDLKQHVVAHIAERVEQRAVDGFLADFTRLRSDVEELQGRVG